MVAENLFKKAAKKIKNKLKTIGAKVKMLQNSINNPAPVDHNEKDQIKGIDSQNNIKLVLDSNKTTVVIETRSGHKLQISEKNNSLLLEDRNGNKIILSQNGIQIV